MCFKILTVAAQPLCLHPDRENLIVGKRSVIVGWGKLSTLNVRSPELQYLEVPLTAWETCLKVYGPTGALDSPKSVGKFSSKRRFFAFFVAVLRNNSNYVDGQWMCAGGEGKDACQGFGGAPLVIRDNGVYKQVRRRMKPTLNEAL